MTEAEKIVCDFVSDFVNKNWNHINTKKCGITESKQDFVLKTQKDFNDAMWVLREVVDWGMDKKYLQDMVVYKQNTIIPYFDVIQINGHYIKVELRRQPFTYLLNIVEPKQKLVTYFE